MSANALCTATLTSWNRSDIVIAVVVAIDIVIVIVHSITQHQRDLFLLETGERFYQSARQSTKTMSINIFLQQSPQNSKNKYFNGPIVMNLGFGSTNCFIWLDLIQSRLISIHIQGSQIIIDAHCKMNYSDKLTYQPDHIMWAIAYYWSKFSLIM